MSRGAFSVSSRADGSIALLGGMTRQKRFPCLDDERGWHHARPSSGIPARWIGMCFLHRGRIEGRFYQCLNLQASLDDLSDEGAECSTLDYDRHALPRF